MNPARLVALVLVASAPLPATRGAETTAAALIDRVVAARAGSTGELIRARLILPDAQGGRDTVVQLRIKVRREGALTRRLYQVMWPKARLGEALYLEAGDDGASTGFSFVPPDTVSPLTSERRRSAFLESELSIDDLIADFWHWPDQAISGQEPIDGEPCTIIDSRPPAGHPGDHALVRSWISLEKLMPLRIDKLDAAGHRVKQFLFSKPVRRDRIWTPRVMRVRSVETGRETTLEITRGERDVAIPAEDFSLESIRTFAAGLRPDGADATP